MCPFSVFFIYFFKSDNNFSLFIVHNLITIPDEFYCLFSPRRICSDDDRQMNWAHIKDKESVKCFTYLLLQKSTFIHTVLYRQLKLNVGKLKICPYKQAQKR